MVVTKRVVKVSDRGGSEIVSALGVPPAQSGLRSRSSGRVVASTRRGTPRTRSRSSSTKSSRAASAQWRSSKTSTRGRLSASASRNCRQAVNVARRRSDAVASSPPRPTSRPRCIAIRCASAGSSRTRRTAAANFRSTFAGGSLAKIPASPLTISPSAQKPTPSPYGSERPWRQVTRSSLRATASCSCETSRDLPMPGTPRIVTSCGDRSDAARSSRSWSRRAPVRGRRTASHGARGRRRDPPAGGSPPRH